MRRDAQFHTYKRRDLTWQNQAACLGEMDYLNEDMNDSWRKGFCMRCPVATECLTYAMGMSNAELDHKGIVYGGYTGHEIVEHKRTRRGAAA